MKELPIQKYYVVVINFTKVRSGYVNKYCYSRHSMLSCVAAWRPYVTAVFKVGKKEGRGESCSHSCSPSDYYPGGKCDLMGCYKKGGCNG